MTILTLEELAGVKKRLEESDPEGWSLETDEYGNEYIHTPKGHNFHFGDLESTDACCYRNARWIVEARNQDVPALIETVEALYQRIAELEKEYKPRPLSRDELKRLEDHLFGGGE